MPTLGFRGPTRGSKSRNILKSEKREQSKGAVNEIGTFFEHPKSWDFEEGLELGIEPGFRVDFALKTNGFLMI